MKKRKVIKQITVLLTCACIASACLVTTAFAAGGVSVSDTYVEIEKGQTAYVSVSANHAAGAYRISTGGPVSASGSGWLDESSVTVGIYGAGAGDGIVSIEFYDLATLDAEDLSGTTLTVSVHVYEPQEVYVPQKGQTDYEPEPSEEAEKGKRTVTIDGTEYTVLNDLAGIEKPKGFTEGESAYNDEKVKVLLAGSDLTLYVLKKKDGGVSFFTYDEKTKKFEKPKTYMQHKLTYYLLDVPEKEEAPEGYLSKDVKVGEHTVKGFVPELKDKADFCYVRAMQDGVCGYYAFDTKEGSIQRAVGMEEAIDADAKVKKVEEAAAKAAKEALQTEKTLKIILLAAAAVFIILNVVIILLAVRLHRQKQKTETE